MSFIRITAVIMTVTFIAVFFLAKIFSFDGFYALYKDSRFSRDGLESAKRFNPDIFLLPSFDGKDFFTSVNDLSIVRRADVRANLYLYLTSGRRYVADSIAKARVLIPVMEPILRNYPDIPRDILLLPLLESGYDPHALSPSYASGIWQFIDGTSSCLGLRNDSYVDERRDILKSTDAALRHLRDLHQQFGSWEVALAAYNAGAGAVRRTMGNDISAKGFWATVDRQGFRPETNEYVARYAALMLIYKHTVRFGIEKDIAILPRPELDSVVFVTPVKLDLLAAQSGIPESVIRSLNPELKGNMTPPYSERYHLKVSAELKPLIERCARDPRWQM